MRLMEEILHHLGCIKPCKSWDKLPTNWCRIFSINSGSFKNSTNLHPIIAFLDVFQIPRSNTTTAGVVNMPGDGNQRPFRLGHPGETSGRVGRLPWHGMEPSQLEVKNRMALQQEKASS